MVIAEGEIAPNAVVFVGEAPGAEDDQQGTIFAGDAGKLLRKVMLREANVDMSSGVPIINMLGCHVPGDRDPTPSEFEACSVWLRRKLYRIQPRLVVAIGPGVARHFILPIRSSERGIIIANKHIRPEWRSSLYYPFKAFYIWHPDYIVRLGFSSQVHMWNSDIKKLGLAVAKARREFDAGL